MQRLTLSWAAAEAEELGEGSGGGEATPEEDYDAEAEEALANTVHRAQQDPLACYDVDVGDEEAALQELKEWLAAARQGGCSEEGV
jgi:hypothetical protein